MPPQKRIADVYLFPNGILAVCDKNGEQISELQGLYSIEKHKQIILEALPDCKFNGFDILPPGFIQSVNNWYRAYADKTMSWDEIKDEHYLDGIPICPTCSNKQDGALGGTRMPATGDFCVCAYCATIGRYNVVDGCYNIRKADDADLDAAEKAGILSRLIAAQDFIKIQITPRKNKYS